jgi:hypothetical protein
MAATTRLRGGDTSIVVSVLSVAFVSSLVIRHLRFAFYHSVSVVALSCFAFVSREIRPRREETEGAENSRARGGFSHFISST